jgi:lipopolysaccharide export system protein LptA
MKNLYVFMLLIFSICYANQPVTYQLINSDEMQIHSISEEYIILLRGNVHFFYGEIEFFADRANIYSATEHVILRGNVVAIQDSLRITASEAIYSHPIGELRVERNVVMTETHDGIITRKATSNLAIHNTQTDEFTMRGNVHIHEFMEIMFARAGHMFFNRETGYGYMLETPFVWREGEDALSISAEKIEFFEDTNRVVASFGVITETQDLRVLCDFLIYYGDDGRLIYIGNPRFYSDSGNGSAELITVFLVEPGSNDIREVLLEGESVVHFRTSPEEPADSWVRSNNMTLIYDDNVPVEFIARENVRSFLRQANDDTELAMDNNVYGEYLNLFFAEDQSISHVRIQERVRGNYRFERRR